MVTRNSTTKTINAEPLSEHNKHAIRFLRERLDLLNVPALLAAYGNECERQDTLLFDLPLLPPSLRDAIAFLVLDRPIALITLENLFSRDVVHMLQEVELAHIENDSLRMNGLRLIHHFGILIFCQQPDISSYCYYSNDSLALGRLLLPARGKVLDLCTGVGTQGMLCALTAKKVIAIEREVRVASIFAVNAVLNGLEEKIELRLGDLLEPIQQERFDLVCCNPPLLPIPDGLPYPPVGHGGPDALAITKKIIEALPMLLTYNGRCHIVGTVLGNHAGPYLQMFQDLAQQYQLNIQLILPCREPLTKNSSMLTTLARTINLYGGIDEQIAYQALLDDFTLRKATYLYSFLLTALLSPTKQAGQVTWTTHFLRNASFWTV